MGRAEHVAKNLQFTMLSELILAGLKFISRRVFVLYMGKEYLGLNGLFTDILSLLSLAELGFGVSITYSLYRPVAQGDKEIIKSLMRLYRRVYWSISAVVLAAGLCLLPFLNFFIREMPKDIPYIPLIYALNVINVSFSYLFSYKATLLFVHQKKYIDSALRAICTLFAVTAQIAVLVRTGNYLYYLCISIVSTLVQNKIVSVKTEKLYPYLKEKTVCPLPEEILKDIRKNVSAMILHRIGSVAVFGTDNLLISKFVGIGITGLYSNYIMIRNFLTALINTLFNAITPAMGNLNVTESAEEKRQAFHRLNFFSAWLFGWISICLIWLYDPFITIWLGEDYLLPRTVVFLIVANFYINSMRIPVANTKSVMGLFWDERYKSILEAVMNLVVSVILARRWGITGILSGTLVSTLTLPFWIEPLGLYRYGLKQKVRVYFVQYLSCLSLTVAAGAVTGLLCRFAECLCRTAKSGSLDFLLKLILCMLVPHVIYLLAWHRRPEYHFLRELAGRMAKRTLPFLHE